MRNIIFCAVCLFSSYIAFGQDTICQIDSIYIYRFIWGKTDVIDQVKISPQEISYRNVSAKSNKTQIQDTANFRKYLLCRSTIFYNELSNDVRKYSKRLKYSYQISVYIENKESKFLIVDTYDLNSENDLSLFGECMKFINSLFPEAN